MVGLTAEAFARKAEGGHSGVGNGLSRKTLSLWGG